eukprot:4715462-Pyramimonas_sp.AAC.1
MAVTKPILADQLRNDKKAYLASTTDDMNASAACRDSSKEWGHLRRHLRFGGRPSRRFKGGKLLPMQRDLNDRVIAADGSQAADAFAHSAQAEGAHKLDRATGCHRYNAAAHVDAKQVSLSLSSVPPKNIVSALISSGPKNRAAGNSAIANGLLKAGGRRSPTSFTQSTPRRCSWHRGLRVQR